MNMRADSFLAAARTALAATEAAVQAGEGTVATVGKAQVLPGSFNIVAGTVTFFVDIRSRNKACIDQVEKAIRETLQKEAENPGITWEIRVMMETDPVETDREVCRILEESAGELGITSKRMLSGAGHDAMIMADIAKIGLVFVPSKGGRSHCPEEWTDYDQLQKGVEVVCAAVEKLAKA